MSLKGPKRVTVRLKCPNPLFEEWLINWKEEAIAKESKMQYAFNYALQSLRKYPLPFESGRDCKILKGFGDKLCKMLDEKLKEHKKTHGTLNNALHALNTDVIVNVTKNAKKQTLDVSKKARKYYSHDNNQDDISITQNSLQFSVPFKAKKLSVGHLVPKENTTKQYIPQYGSGGYAILVTLYKQSLQPNYPGFMTKAQIIENGKDLVNSSFTKPDPGSRYTAWSSMKSLLSKDLVSKMSNPAKFSLTQEGKTLARKLYENSDKNEDNKKNNSDCDIQSLGIKNISEKFVSSNFSDEYKSESMTNITNNCRLYDIDIPDEFTDELFRNSWIPNNDTFSVDRNNDNNKVHIDLKVKDKYTKDCDTVTSASSEFAICTGTYGVQEDGREGYKDYSEPLKLLEDVETSRQANIKMVSKEYLSSRSASSQENSSESRSSSLSVNGKSTFQKFYSTDSVSSVKSVTNIPSKNKENTLKRFTSNSSATSTTSTASVMDNFVMAPCSFDIILYVDNNETLGSSNSQNDEILVSLTKQEIKYEVKDLKVGDFLWICRDRITKKELVLPYIIERKRMDDFAHSIRDKRYHEQKFRLKKCGIENLIYLVENHGKNQHLGLPLQTLYQATSNTAIQENFFIKFTDNTKETMEYLVNFSRILVKMFKSKTLASCSKDDIQPVDIHDDLVSLITFRELNESSIKNKRMKVTELFVKMLIQIKGMSVERALAITQVYPTPILLKKVYEEISGSQAEKLLSSIKYGRYGKSLGVALSKTIYQAFTKTNY